MLGLNPRDELDDEAGRIEALIRLDAATSSSEASFDHITKLLQIALEMEMVTISLVGVDKQTFKACQGLDLTESPREIAFCNIAIRSYEPLIIEDTHQDARVKNNPLVTGSLFLRSYIGAPLTTADGYNLGTICAFDSRPRRFTARESEMIIKCAELVVNQLELRSQAKLDFLTGVLNRRSFASELEREMARLKRRPGKAVVAFLDIDHFKRVNDTFGHPVGDIVLREFAGIVASQCRQNDLLARVGGEEFAVLLPDTDLESAQIWAERTRKQVAETRFDDNDDLRVTVSLGLVEFTEKQTSADVITSMADRTLYQAKRQGRNRVVT
ncbi:GGDEF domain-containing protein [Roseovarius sp. D0-M9]|uniref:GGDEF domain-containing protein n=1 Tax=Roseovarius sp. D0-M9 TaxID=3127117 RepID=UPI00300FDE4F